MSEIQKQALKIMADKNIGAIITKFGWTWPETCRNNEDAAKEVVKKLTGEK